MGQQVPVLDGEQLHFAIYITGHGLGHATREVEVARHLLLAGHAVTLVTGSQLDSITEGFLPPSALVGDERYSIRRKILDCGAKQSDAFTVDMAASLELYHETAVEHRDELLAAEVAWLTAAGVHVVVSDTVALACAAAHAAQLPCAVVTNFSWDFIYSEYLASLGSELRPMVWQIAEDFARASQLLRLPGHSPMPAFRDVVDVPLLVRPAMRSRDQVRQSLGVGTDERLVLLMYGGQPAGSAWHLSKQALPVGFRCLVCSGGKQIGDAPLPDNFQLAASGAYTPDLVAAADVVLGKIGYGTTSECLASNTPLVFVRRSHFNEEPFLRSLLEMHGCCVEMRRRDFLAGNWAPFIAQASQLKPSYSAPTNGGEVVAEKLIALARGGSSPALPTADGPDPAGSLRLRDTIVWGVCMQRATRRRTKPPAPPSWYTAGLLPTSDIAENATFGLDEAGSSSSSEDDSDSLLQLDGFDIVAGSLHGGRYPDTLAFLRRLLALDDEILGRSSPGAADLEAARGLFNWQEEVVVSRAPGRLDVFGGIADYSGSLVLQLPLAEACHVAVQRTSPEPGQQPALRIVSLGGDECDRAPSFDVPLAELTRNGAPMPLDEARSLFADDPSRSWAAYVAGALLVLMLEAGTHGGGSSLAVLIHSDVPPGSGVSSSAALEVAAMTAFAAVLDVQLQPHQLALLCQKVENRVVGAPCGVMDQMASALGRRRKLMALRCRPASVEPPVALPPHLRVWGLDSGIRHSVGGADYGAVRAAAFMGLRMMSAREAAAHPSHPAPAPTAGRPPQQPQLPLIGGGYLCAMSPSLFQQAHEAALPEALSGADFLAAYGGHLDAATTVDPDTWYPVRQAAAHPIHENFRVEAFRAILQGVPTAVSALLKLGELMFQSHASYSRCGLGSTGTDLLVDLVRRHIAEVSAEGEQPALFGAKITGGGSGGTVCILGSADGLGQAAVDRIVTQYHDATRHQPRVFQGTSSGSAAFGTLRLRRRK